MSDRIEVNAHYYQQFDADYTRDVPGEGYGGWQQATIPLSPKHTAIAVMHAWDTGSMEKYPGWYRAVEYLPRAERIVKEVFPPLLNAVRNASMKVYHVVREGEHYKHLLGYQRAAELGNTLPHTPRRAVVADAVLDELRAFRATKTFVGPHNQHDVDEGFAALQFPPEAIPVDDEGVTESSRQLLALCEADEINHLIYIGFAINGCILMSPGGMFDMSRHGIMCSTVRDAVTAIENKETARKELNKAEALWRIGLLFGFVFEAKNLQDALETSL